jgi:protein arginine N-methyltransferase 5
MALVHLACGRNCKAVSFPTSLFLTNKRGYPTLSKSHQMLFTELLRRLGRTLRVLVEGAPLHLIGHRNDDDDDNRSSGTQCLAYLQYLKHLRARPEVAGVIDTPEAIMETNYLDHLQAPLQPLGDNLEFQTYETFEKDPVKYRQYALAVELAIQDLLRIQEKSSPKPAISTNANVKSTIPPTRVIRIMVLGAGRGPLVRSALQAIAAINRKAGRTVVISQILAVEKNPSAVLYLQSVRARDPMWACVTVVSGDMRTIPQTNPVVANLLKEGIQADVMVSELLGSFGCNELSPECLDGAYECMAGLISKDASKTICIPERYSSFLAPVSSMKLYSEARAQSYTPYNAADGPAGMPAGSLRAFETPYVVRTHAAAQTHAEQFCWEFQHPIPPGNTNNNANNATATNERYCKLTFSPDASHGAGSGCGYGAFDKTVAGMASQELAGTTPMGPSSSRPPRTPQSVTIHGFLGTFDSILYKSKHVTSGQTATEARISIVPSTFSTGMFSWFPLYFPLKEPMVIPSGATLEASMWRRMEGTKVWYEWCAQVILSRPPSSSSSNNGYQDPPIVLSASVIHNPNGRSCHVRL